MGGRFQGSCFVMRGFRLAKMNAKPPLKHDMFSCQVCSVARAIHAWKPARGCLKE